MCKLSAIVGNVLFLFVLLAGLSAWAEYQPLEITPAGDLLITGYYEEPLTYTPTSVEYTLINYQTNQMRVDIAVDVTWLSAPTFINVPGSGEGLPQPRYIDVALQPEAYDLTPGIYIGTIAFTHDLRNGDIPQIITVILHVKVRLCEALDNCDLEFTTGGDAEWYGQWAENYYDGDSAQSGALPETTQATWLETEIDNLGDLTFWWKVSSEENYAPLELWINDELVDSISGDVGWTANTVYLGSNPFYIANGYNKIRWQYAKYRAYPVGADAGWVDYVTFEAEDYLIASPSAPALYENCLPVDDAALNTTSTTTYTLTNTATSDPLNWTASVSENWLALSSTTGALTAGATTNVDATFTAAVETLPAGAYSASLLFTNVTSGYEILRTITLLLSDEVPPVPAAPIPENGDTNVSPTAVLLSWDGGDITGCNTYYDVYFGEVPGSLALVYTGTNTSFALPELDELTTYYWRVDSENCCGVPAQASPVWSFTTGEYNALVYFGSCGGGQDYATPALNNLDFMPLVVTDAITFVDRLASREWQVVIVDVMGESLNASVITALTAYYAAGGYVIFSHADLGTYPDNDFLDRAGVIYVESYTVPKNVYRWLPTDMFYLPNNVGDITGFLFSGACPVSGHLIALGDEATAYAGYTPAPQEGAAAIVVNDARRIIFNAFSPQAVVGDQNLSGKPDMVELYENQIVLVAPYGCDPDVTPPEIELIGANPMLLECGDGYVSPGVFAWDRCDGLISELVDIDVSGLDAGVEGTYTVYYSVTDSSGNTSEVLERTVQVVDSTAPFIALLGTNPFVQECTFPYQTPGVFAWDDCDGIISEQVVIDDSGLDTAVPGTYSVFYSVSDSAGHASVVLERIVNVVDGLPPVITILGDNPLIVECAGIYEEPGATALDLCAGDVSAAIGIYAALLNTGAVGEYPIEYACDDGAGNSASETRTVLVVDTTIPEITLTGDAEVVVECGDLYTEDGATAMDACDGDLTDAIVIAGDVVDTAVVGVYVVTYNVSDNEANAAVEMIRTVSVVDTTLPEITLTGDAEVTVECGDAYTESGATATDICSGDLTDAIMIAGDTVETNVVGVYTVTYNVSDDEANAAVEVTRTVTVEDTTIPVITRIGDAQVTVECASEYIDQGATAEDHCDGDITNSIVTVNPVDTAIPGEYVVTYDVEDGESNAAVQVTRNVTVVNTTIPVIALPAPYIPIECGEFDTVFADVAKALAVTAANACGDVTEAVRVSQIKVTYPRKGDEITYTVASLNADLIQAGKITGFEGSYTGTLAETIKIFQNYFLFKPAIYEITYVVQNSEAEPVTQFIRIDDKCRGPLGCYSCDSCAQQRPVATVKQLLSDWLLLGLSLLVLSTLSATKHKM